MNSSIDMVTVRFDIETTAQRKKHPEEYEFYNGTWMRYFGGIPVMWWPQDAQFGILGDYSMTEGVRLRYVPNDGSYPKGAPVVEMRLPRAALTRERRATYTIVDDASPQPEGPRPGGSVQAAPVRDV